MFKPDRTFKKLARQYKSCAYIYKDGIVLVEKRSAQSGKYNTEIEITHIWPCENKLYARNNGTDKISRIVVHDPTELLAGLEKVEIYFHNASEKSKDFGLEFWSIHCTAPSGMEWSRNACNLISDNFTIQPNPQDGYNTTYSGNDSVHSWTDGNIEIHN